MRHTIKLSRHKDATPGFACKITDDFDLGIAMLVCEDEEGHYEPVGPVVSLNEAREIAKGHFRSCPNDMDGICPYIYKVWATGLEGGYAVARTIDPLKFF